LKWAKTTPALPSKVTTRRLMAEAGKCGLFSTATYIKSAPTPALTHY